MLIRILIVFFNIASANRFVDILENFATRKTKRIC